MPASPRDEITPEPLYLNRRNFLRTSIYAGTLLATGGVYRYFRGSGAPAPEPAGAPPLASATPPKLPSGEPATSFTDITHYNNFYEFSTSKEQVAERAARWVPGPWNLEVGGLVHRPLRFSLADLAQFRPAERVYRFRCVEGWSMVIPWWGFSLADLIKRAEPTGEAKYVAFESFYDEAAMPDARRAGLPFPYVEGLRLDEALHPLTLVATGLYGKPMPNQNGAPVRLVVPWKYGFKSIKSITKITLTSAEPPTTWNLANAAEYGFYSNVNPHVPHPRWSQAEERRIGEGGLRPTAIFNGYDEVAPLYAGLDLKEHF